MLPYCDTSNHIRVTGLLLRLPHQAVTTSLVFLHRFMASQLQRDLPKVGMTSEQNLFERDTIPDTWGLFVMAMEERCSSMSFLGLQSRGGMLEPCSLLHHATEAVTVDGQCRLTYGPMTY